MFVKQNSNRNKKKVVCSGMNSQLKHQYLNGKIFKIFGKGENAILKDLAFYGGLDNPLGTMLYFLALMRL